MCQCSVINIRYIFMQWKKKCVSALNMKIRITAPEHCLPNILSSATDGQQQQLMLHKLMISIFFPFFFLPSLNKENFNNALWVFYIDLLESSPHKGTSIADITSKIITEMAYRW